MLFGLIITALIATRGNVYTVPAYTDGCCIITENGEQWATDVFRPSQDVMVTFYDNGTPYYTYDDIVINVE